LGFGSLMASLAPDLSFRRSGDAMGATLAFLSRADPDTVIDNLRDMANSRVQLPGSTEEVYTLDFASRRDTLATFVGSVGVSLAASAGSALSRSLARSLEADQEAGAPRSPLLERYVSETGGRWGGTETRLLNDRLATELEGQGYRVTGGAGRASEEWIPGPGGGTRGGTFVDITATNGSSTVRTQTVTTLSDGITPTPAEAAAAARIRAAFPNDELRIVPKPRH